MIEIFLVIFVKVNKVSIIVMPLSHGAVSGEVPLLPALKACSIGVPTRRSLCGCCPASSGSPSTPTPVWSTGMAYIHWDRLVIYPSGGIGGTKLLLLLLLPSLSLVVVPVISSVVVASVGLTEERAIQCISSSRCRYKQRYCSSASIAACSSFGSLS